MVVRRCTNDVAARHWEKEGFVSTQFLWIPQGYSSAAKLLDDPEVSRHAHGIFLEDGKTQKRMYTHFPSWYAVPFGVFAKLGIYSKTFYQTFAVLVSTFTLFFLFLFVRMHFGEPIAIFSVLLYSLNPGYLSYSDSLATMPLNDFLRFFFLWVWAKYQQHLSRGYFRASLLTIFIAFLVSLDNHVFIPVWATAYHFIYMRRRNILPIVGLAFPAILAVSISFLQNVSYLGFAQAKVDWLHQFSRFTTMSASGGGAGQAWFSTVVDSAREYSKRFFGLQFWRLLVLLSLAGYFVDKKLRSKTFILLGSLFVSAFAMLAVFPDKVLNMDYERQLLLPFFSISVSLFITGTLKFALSLWRTQRQAYAALMFVFLILYLQGPAKLWVKEMHDAVDYPTRGGLAKEPTLFLEKLGRSAEDKVVFSLGPKTLPTFAEYGAGSHQVDPLVEYHSNATVLGITDLDVFWQDANYLWNHRTQDFGIIIVFKDSERNQVEKYLMSRNVVFRTLPVSVPGYEVSAIDVILKRHADKFSLEDKKN